MTAEEAAPGQSSCSSAARGSSAPTTSPDAPHVSRADYPRRIREALRAAAEASSGLGESSGVAGVKKGGIRKPATGEIFLGRAEVRRREWEGVPRPFRVQSAGSVAYELVLPAAGTADATCTLSPKHEWYRHRRWSPAEAEDLVSAAGFELERIPFTTCGLWGALGRHRLCLSVSQRLSNRLFERSLVAGRFASAMVLVARRPSPR
jgi:hypothetical protein